MKLPANMLREIAGHLGHANRGALRATSRHARQSVDRSTEYPTLEDIVRQHKGKYFVNWNYPPRSAIDTALKLHLSMQARKSLNSGAKKTTGFG